MKLERRTLSAGACLFLAAALGLGAQTTALEEAQNLISNRDFQRAIDVASDYLRENPLSVQGRLVLANAYFMAQKLNDALQAAQQVLELEADHPDALKIKANAEYLLGDFGAAEGTLLGFLVRHPDDEAAAYMLGRMYYQEKRYEHAAGLFQRVLRVNPRSYKAYDNLGLCYEALHETDLAIRHYLTAIKLVEEDHPEYDWPYANLANLLIDQGDLEKAFSAAVKAANRNPHSARNFYLGGKALSKLGETEQAVKWLQRSIELDPRYSEPLYLLGHIYQRMGEKEKAAETFQRFLEVKAQEPAQRR